MAAAVETRRRLGGAVAPLFTSTTILPAPHRPERANQYDEDDGEHQQQGGLRLKRALLAPLAAGAEALERERRLSRARGEVEGAEHSDDELGPAERKTLGHRH